MILEGTDVVVQIDPVPVDDVVIAIDPVDLGPVDLGPVDLGPVETGPIAIAEPLPADVPLDIPADAQTFGGPVDVAVDPVVVDDGTIFTTTVVDDTPADSGSAADPGTDVVIGRPVDPEPNWRTLDGHTDGGIVPGGEDPVVVDVPVYKGEDAGPDTATGDTAAGDDSATPTDVIYTLDPSDPLIYATSTGVLDGPGRHFDPLPYERGIELPAAAPEPEIDHTPVHYAVSEPFHTGLDLL